jgi:hypothetical protein
VLFGLLVWFSSFVVALSLVENTSDTKNKETNSIYYGVFIFVFGESGFRRLQRIANLIRRCDPFVFGGGLGRVEQFANQRARMH